MAQTGPENALRSILDGRDIVYVQTAELDGAIDCSTFE
jgi:hypothetical protein